MADVELLEKAGGVQNIIIDKPYKFIPPIPSRVWPRIVLPFIAGYLRKNYGLEAWELRGLERFRASQAAGHGVILAANHCRPCDPILLLMLMLQAGQPTYTMASWHLFMQGRFNRWLLPRVGVFSMYREGFDRDSLKFAIGALGRAERPLLIYPEGVVSRTNGRLNNLMEGISFMARNAAKQRAALDPARGVVIHPVGLRYFFEGNLEQALEPVLEKIEKRLSWRPQRGMPLARRIAKLGEGLLALKEIEYQGRASAAGLHERLKTLIDRLLVPLEAEWLNGKSEGDVIARVKNIRAAIMPAMAAGEVSAAERARRWDQLADTYLAQQIYLYPPDYFDNPPTAEQMLETAERLEEDLTDVATIHRPLRVVVEIGEAIEVGTTRERGGAVDPLMVRLRGNLEEMLERLKEESKDKDKGQVTKDKWVAD